MIKAEHRYVERDDQIITTAVVMDVANCFTNITVSYAEVLTEIALKINEAGLRPDGLYASIKSYCWPSALINALRRYGWQLCEASNYSLKPHSDDMLFIALTAEAAIMGAKQIAFITGDVDMTVCSSLIKRKEIELYVIAHENRTAAELRLWAHHYLPLKDLEGPQPCEYHSRTRHYFNNTAALSSKRLDKRVEKILSQQPNQTINGASLGILLKNQHFDVSGGLKNQLLKLNNPKIKVFNSHSDFLVRLSDSSETNAPPPPELKELSKSVVISLLKEQLQGQSTGAAMGSALRASGYSSTRLLSKIESYGPPLKVKKQACGDFQVTLEPAAVQTEDSPGPNDIEPAQGRVTTGSHITELRLRAALTQLKEQNLLPAHLEMLMKSLELSCSKQEAVDLLSQYPSTLRLIRHPAAPDRIKVEIAHIWPVRAMKACHQ